MGRGLSDPGLWAGVQGRAPSLVGTWQVALAGKGGQSSHPEEEPWLRVITHGRLPPGRDTGPQVSFLTY